MEKNAKQKLELAAGEDVAWAAEGVQATSWKGSEGGCDASRPSKQALSEPQAARLGVDVRAIRAVSECMRAQSKKTSRTDERNEQPDCFPGLPP